VFRRLRVLGVTFASFAIKRLLPVLRDAPLALNRASRRPFVK